MQLALLAQLAFGLATVSAASLPQEPPTLVCSTREGRGFCENGSFDCDVFNRRRQPFCPGTGYCCITSWNSGKRNDECSDPQKNSCTFYKSCLEEQIECGPDGYAIAYGDHYCNKFSEASEELSERGQGWVTETMYCLQQKLIPFGTGQQQSTCPDLKKFAFGTHPDCYIKGGVCLLPPTDWLVIVNTVGFLELFDSVDALVATLKTVKGCLDFYLWLIKNHVIGMSKAWDVSEKLAIAPPQSE